MRKINAFYDDNTIRVYQAYINEIADEALELGTFGNHFKRTRMTWIKPSFLWMMYRAGWAEKEGQERILAIDITKEGFLTILKNSVLSHYDRKVYEKAEDWEKDKRNFSGRCQWDPERTVFGGPMEYRAIQLGIKDKIVDSYVNNWIVHIEDITPMVRELKKMRDEGRDIKEYLPVEKEFRIEDPDVIKRLGIDL
ncbi:DUF4291 domain-containing protein [Sebaldella sp. S0638]|uniref:DUF4291 domain-containing protein n=1 Tax=Sebaldella sp. S0638 TaxID=2957809 RepID=UPI00209CA66E|nr:DUF4291 domain-containing protein [Sebaldella sp. S0638]MCP1223145.1 DUF4291 domain-containing protein [Sebaldella sp. S0638]